MENLQGTLLKGYRLEERIGNGGFGAVYRAKQPTIGREVAVKIILPGYANNPDFIRRFESEAHLIARLEHPHITPLHDFWRDPDGAYLVMRYLKGGSIRDAIQESAYELDAVSRLLDQIASALHFAHRNDVIHRDIKPGNILLDEDGNAYLADFGIAKDLAGITDNKTAADAVVGSLDYISPEQARSEPVTPRTDIYSLGVTLYEMITGHHPFNNASPIERLYKHINDPLPEISNLPDDVRDAINATLSKATAKNPEDRYADVLGLAVAFREAIGRGMTQRDENIVEQLTIREQEVLALIARNMTNREIADELVVTMGTVKWHITQLYKKLGVRSRVQAIIRARELNLIVTGDTTDNLPYLAQQAVSISLPEPENPYKGLHAFQMTDARDFFGRDDLTKKLIVKLCDDDPYHRFLAIVGPSGSGKSSLVKAGVIPALWKGAISGSEKWFVVDMIPGSRPLDKLEIALMRVSANQSQNLRQQLERDDHGLSRVADLILPADNTELVIVIDQFEEVFTLVEDEAMRQHFLNLLRVAVSSVRSRIRVIVTLRADYYDRPLHYPEFGELVRNRMETVLPLTAKGLERAVRGPAERVGVTFEQGLVEQIVSQMNYQAGALPLLQYALTELFDRREGRLLTNEAYQKIGGAIGALAHRADEIYRGLTTEGQELAQQMFMRLVTLGEGAEDTRRRATHTELLALTENTDLMEEIIDQFAAYRLLSLDHDPATRQPTVEVAHEAILREWGQLREWINSGRGDIHMQYQLSQMSSEWHKSSEDVSYLLRGSRLEQFEEWLQVTTITLTADEKRFLTESTLEHERQLQRQAEQEAREIVLHQRAAQRLRYLVGALTVFLIVAAGLTLFAFGERGRAEIALDLSQQRGTEVAEQAKIAEQQRNQAVSRNQADLARRFLEQGNIDLALAVALEAVSVDSPPPVAEEIFARAANAASRRILRGHTDYVQNVTFNPTALEVNGTLYEPGQIAFSTSRDQTGRLWDVTTGEIIRVLDGNWTQSRIFFNPMSLEIDGTLYLPGQLALVISWEMMRLWDVTTDETLRIYEGHKRMVFGAAFSPVPLEIDGTRYEPGYLAITAGEDRTMRLWDILTGETLRIYEGHSGGLQSAVFNPAPLEINGVLYAQGHLALTAARDNTMRLWDVLSGETLHIYEGHTDWVIFVDFNPAFLEINGTNYGPGQLALSASSDTTLRLWNVITGETLHIFEGHTDLLWPASFSPDAQMAVSGSGDLTTRLWDVTTGETLRVFKGHTQWVSGLAFSPDGKTIISGSDDYTARLWDVATIETLRVFEEHSSGVDKNVAFSTTLLEDGGTSSGYRQLMLSGFNNPPVRLLDMETGETLRIFDGTVNLQGGFAFSPAPEEVSDTPFGDGQLTIQGSSDYTVVMSRGGVEQEYEVVHIFEGYASAMRDVVFNPAPLEISGVSYAAGQLALTASGDRTLRLWNVETGRSLKILEGHTDFVRSVGFNPAPLEFNGMRYAHGQLALSASSDGTMRLWDVTSGITLREYHGHNAGLSSVAFSPDGDTALSASGDQTLRLWDIATGATLRIFEGHTGGVMSVVFSLDGQYALSGSDDGTLRLWNVAAGETVHIFEGHTASVTSAAFSPTSLVVDGTSYAAGQLVLSASSDHTLRLWDVATTEILRVFEGHTDLVTDVDFSPDGQTALSSSFDHTVRLWDVAAGETLRVLEGHTDLVRSVAFSPDGKTAISTDHTVRLWRIQTLDELIAYAYENRHVYQLTCDERRRFFTRVQCDKSGALTTPRPPSG